MKNKGYYGWIHSLNQAGIQSQIKGFEIIAEQRALKGTLLTEEGKAKKITMSRQKLYMKGRLGMLIDGTGDDYKKIQSRKEAIEKLGYDAYMIFVNTSLEVALQRNAARSRSIPDELVKEIWQSVQDNIGHFQGLFGGQNMIIIDNSLTGTAHIKQMEGAIAKLLRKPVQNHIGKQWIKANS